MRKWDAGPSPVFAESQALCRRHVVLLGTAVLVLCLHWPCLVWGVGPRVLGHFVAWGPWAHSFLSLSLSFLIL